MNKKLLWVGLVAVIAIGLYFSLNKKAVAPINENLTATTTQISSLSPLSGIAGNEVTIRGENLNESSVVLFGNYCEICSAYQIIKPSSVSKDGTSLTFKAPPVATGPKTTFDVRIRNGDFVSSPLTFTMNPNGVVVNETKKTPVVSAATNTKTSITLVSPNGGESWTLGESYPIKWSIKQGTNEKVGNLIMAYAVDQNGNENHMWTYNLTPGDNNTTNIRSSGASGKIPAGMYKLRIKLYYSIPSLPCVGCKGTQEEIAVDTSDNYFTIASAPKPLITLLYPNGGEVLNNGGRENIATVKWNTSNFSNMLITIVLLNKNGDAIKTIATNIPNTGSYDWKMDKAIDTGEYKIAVTSPQSMDNSTSGPVASHISNTFVIVKRDAAVGKPFVTLISPNGGETLKVGDKVIIKWSNLGEKATSATITLSNEFRCPYGYSCNPLPNSSRRIIEISGNDLEKGEYTWTVDKNGVESPSGLYLINILLQKDNLGYASADGSDTTFTITN